MRDISLLSLLLIASLLTSLASTLPPPPSTSQVRQTVAQVKEALEGMLPPSQREKLMSLAGGKDYAYAQLGFAYTIKGYPVEALWCFSKASEDELNPDILSNMGMILIGMERYGEAERLLLYVVHKHQHLPALLNLSVLYMRTGRYGLARVCIQRARELQPFAYTEKLSYKLALMSGDTDEAINSLLNWHLLAPNDEEAEEELSKLREELPSSYREAISTRTKLITDVVHRVAVPDIGENMDSFFLYEQEGWFFHDRYKKVSAVISKPNLEIAKKRQRYPFLSKLISESVIGFSEVISKRYNSSGLKELTSRGSKITYSNLKRKLANLKRQLPHGSGFPTTHNELYLSLSQLRRLHGEVRWKLLSLRGTTRDYLRGFLIYRATTLPLVPNEYREDELASLYNEAELYSYHYLTHVISWWNAVKPAMMLKENVIASSPAEIQRWQELLREEAEESVRQLIDELQEGDISPDELVPFKSPINLWVGINLSFMSIKYYPEDEKIELSASEILAGSVSYSFKYDEFVAGVGVELKTPDWATVGVNAKMMLMVQISERRNSGLAVQTEVGSFINGSVIGADIPERSVTYWLIGGP